MSVGENPLSYLTNSQVSNTQLMLALACGKSHRTLTKKRRQYFCHLQRALEIEADLRGLPQVRPPYHAGDVEPFAL